MVQNEVVVTIQSEVRLNPTLLKSFDAKKGKITSMIVPPEEPTPVPFGQRPGKENMTFMKGVAFNDAGQTAGGEPYRPEESGGKIRMTKVDLSRL